MTMVVADTTKVQIFKQITTRWNSEYISSCCCWYHKGTNFQANHNMLVLTWNVLTVVADTTKVQIFKQITTYKGHSHRVLCCCWYHKGTNFQANHNSVSLVKIFLKLLLIPQRYKFSSKSQRICAIYPNSGVVADTTKVQIFKQITTRTRRISA